MEVGSEICMPEYLHYISILSMLSIYQCDGTLYKNFMVEIFHNFEKGTAKQIKFRDKGD